jgi:hypothetical protein
LVHFVPDEWAFFQPQKRKHANMQVPNTPTSMLEVLEVSNMTPSKLYVVLGKRPQGTDEATVTLWEGVLEAGATLHEQTPASNFEYVVEAGVPRLQGREAPAAG